MLNTKKDFQVADEKLIEDGFSEMFNNRKAGTIVQNYTKKFILGDGTKDCNSICGKANDHLSILDTNQTFRNVFYWEGV